MAETVAKPTLRSDRLRGWILVALSATQLLLVLDSTVMNVALPTTQTDLGFTDADRPWVITAYALTFGSLLLVGGRLADTFGRKRLLLISLTGFIIASLVGGLATDFSMLVSARALQGISGALMAPATLSLLATSFSNNPARGKAFGIFGAVSSSGSAIGLILGGFLTEYLDWRWCLLINVVIGIAIVALAIKLIPPPGWRNTSSRGRTRRARRPHLDLRRPRDRLRPHHSRIPLLDRPPHHRVPHRGGLVLLALFVLIENKTARPILPMHVVVDRNRGGAYLMVTIAGVGMFGVFLFLTYHLQVVLAFTSLATGLAFLPMVAMLVIGAIFAGSVLLPRIGARALAATGLVSSAAGAASFTLIDAGSTYAVGILPGLIIAGIGFGLVFGPAMNLATLGVDPENSGAASAMVNAAQQVGAAFGTALLNTIAVSATTAHLAAHPAATDAAMHSLIHGNTIAFWTTSGILLTGALACGLLIQPGRGTTPANSTENTPMN